MRTNQSARASRPGGPRTREDRKRTRAQWAARGIRGGATVEELPDDYDDDVYQTRQTQQQQQQLPPGQYAALEDAASSPAAQGADAAAAKEDQMEAAPSDDEDNGDELAQALEDGGHGSEQEQPTQPGELPPPVPSPPPPQLLDDDANAGAIVPTATGAVGWLPPQTATQNMDRAVTSPQYPSAGAASAVAAQQATVAAGGVTAVNSPSLLYINSSVVNDASSGVASPPGFSFAAAYQSFRADTIVDDTRRYFFTVIRWDGIGLDLPLWIPEGTMSNNPAFATPQGSPGGGARQPPSGTTPYIVYVGFKYLSGNVTPGGAGVNGYYTAARSVQWTPQFAGYPTPSPPSLTQPGFNVDPTSKYYWCTNYDTFANCVTQAYHNAINDICGGNNPTDGNLQLVTPAVSAPLRSIGISRGDTLLLIGGITLPASTTYSTPAAFIAAVNALWTGIVIPFVSSVILSYSSTSWTTYGVFTFTVTYTTYPSVYLVVSSAAAGTCLGCILNNLPPVPPTAGVSALVCPFPAGVTVNSALPTLPGNGQNTSIYTPPLTDATQLDYAKPYLYWNPATKSFAFISQINTGLWGASNVSTNAGAEGQDGYFTFGMNAALYALLRGFRAINNGPSGTFYLGDNGVATSSPPGGIYPTPGYTLLQPAVMINTLNSIVVPQIPLNWINWNIVSNPVVATSVTLPNDAYTWTQEYSSADALSPIGSLAFNTSQMPLAYEVTSTPTLSSANTASTSNAASPVFTDIALALEGGASDYLGAVSYVPSGEYRWIQLQPTTSWRSLEWYLTWIDRRTGTPYPVNLLQGGSVRAKFLLQAKDV